MRASNREYIPADPVDDWWSTRLDAGSQLSISGEWATEVPICKLVDEFQASFWGQFSLRRALETSFGMRMWRLCPGITIRKSIHWIDARSSDGRIAMIMKRVNCWRFPSLEECRASFEAEIGRRGIVAPNGGGMTKVKSVTDLDIPFS
jgi:hypothetical protein